MKTFAWMSYKPETKQVCGVREGHVRLAIAIVL